MAKKKISEITIETDEEVGIGAGPAPSSKLEVKGMAKAMKALGKINSMQIEVTQDYEDLKNLKSFHSGCSALDTIMGYRGYPYGKFVEIFGKESSGKSTLAMHCVNSAVNDYNGYALIMDVENNAWEFPKRNIELGLKKENLDRVMCVHPATTEDAMNAAYEFVKTIVVDSKITDVPVVIVWDSIAANTSQDEQEKDIGNIGYLTQSRIIAQGHRKIVSLLNEHKIKNVTFIWLNQARDGQAKVSFMPPPTTTFGGKAPAFYSSIRIELKTKKNIAMTRNGQKVQVGLIVTAKTVKNKIAFCRQTTDIYIMFQSGIDDAFTTYEWLKAHKLVKQSGGMEHILLSDPIEGTEGSPGLLELSFNGLGGFRRIFAENKDAIQKMMRVKFDELLASCSKDLMSVSPDVDANEDAPEES